MIVNGLAIGIPVLLLAAGCGLVVLLLRRDDGRHAADALFTAAPEVHHAEYTPYDYTPERPETPANACEHGWPGSTCGQAHPYIASPASLVPGAGLNLSPGYNSRPAQSAEDIGMKADSPAPENVPGRDRTDPAGDLPYGLAPMSPELARFIAEAREDEEAAQAAADWDQLAGTTRRPFRDCLSQDTITRGMPAFRGL